MLTGSISSLGTHYVIALEALNCSSGDSIAREQVEAENKEKVLKTLGSAVPKLRSKLGESLSSIQKFDVPIEQATTTSLEALKAHAIGEQMRARGLDEASIPSYLRAIELDPHFAVAYGKVAQIYSNLGEFDRAQEYSKKAYALRDRVSEIERFYIDNAYYRNVTGELSKRIENLELWKQVYPRDWSPPNSLGVVYLEIGDHERALEEYNQAYRLNPHHRLPLSNLATTYERLDRYEEAKMMCQRAITEKLDGSGIHTVLYRIAFIEGNMAAMEREAEWSKGKSAERGMLSNQCRAAVFVGKVREAAEFSRRSFEIAEQRGLSELAGLRLGEESRTAAEFGFERQARELAAKTLRVSNGVIPKSFAAAALARSGDSKSSEAILKDLSSRYSLDTWLHNVVLPTTRAETELHRSNPARAVELLRSAAPYERATYIPIYTRGRAYLQQHDGKSAAAEFQKILDHRGVSSLSMYHPLARLGLARAYALSGDKARSRRAYQDFLSLWKDADPDIPILQQAKAEYAKLQ